ncbi:adenosylhomocysteinase [Candidatus Roizmanbacteria bacterium RIFCSPLOWO2_01_FULL_37_12]|uniref:Adenosylhomocysteinase n=1 Tax=Candidatus Roizmanbacteria bacterium RIFCSPLOWO2_01_FULL_37_12 TaxID=1802056 RepID=A0A1F7IFT3_9BACT|nr:MAG: adenosylhomocysteinase [Candidatus Roizmanbacteria bacterium RIFCSPHIGHO2_02_FULL_37_9b]OGK42224.1 MAG: adenosylhomocysteinase [Candidatus Roizmanbacteria bacterium RIFCSPLOWO2_01_FULL_37_12]
MSKIKDPKLAIQGKLRIEWARMQMPVLLEIEKDYKKEKPFKGMVFGISLHVTDATAVLVQTIKAGGAEVKLAGCNPLSTQDDIAASLDSEGVEVFAWKNQNNKDYYWSLNKVLDANPNITLDDGGDLLTLIHTKRKNLLKTVIGGQEETTTGVIRLRAMAKDKALQYPVVAVNDTPTKHMFDNVYGTGQSTIDGILRATNILLAGKTVVVCGYGYCGKGLANRMRGMGAKVILIEVDPVLALQASMDGFSVMRLIDAAKIGDIFVTVTGDKHVIRKEHFQKMKDGAILANSGHFNSEINISDLELLAKSKRTIREFVEEFLLKNGKRIYLLAQGRLVNLAAAEGHPPSVMDMSFANHALCAKWLVENYKSFKPEVYNVPKEIDEKIARLKLQALGIQIDSLTKEQKKYLTSWSEGT